MNSETNKIKIIFDTDLYNECDDQFALTYILKSLDVFDLQAITLAPYSNKVCLVSDSQNLSYKEAIKICSMLGYNYKNKIFKGAQNYMDANNNLLNDAVEKIIEIANKNNLVYILAVGAITNVALALQKAPQIKNKIKVVWLGGNSLMQQTNNDYNFRQDVLAVKTVLNSGVDLTIIPCKNVASNLLTSVYELEHFLQGKNKLYDYLIKRFYNDGYHDIQERRIIWDISVVAFMLNKNWFDLKQISCPTVDENNSYVFTENSHKITMVTYLNAKKIYKDFFDRLTK